MSQISCGGLPPAAGDSASPGHPSDRAGNPEFVGRTSATAPGRALVPATPLVHAAAGPSPVRQPQAAFLAQLIATALAAPQTRARRRARPDDASAAYAKAMALPTARRATVRRSM